MRMPLRRVLAATMAAAGLGAWVPTTLSCAQDQTGVATAPVRAQGAEVDTLRGRVAAFWAARVEGDSKGQWDLLEPRGRGRLSPGDYSPVRGVMKYLAYQVEDATVNGTFATVKVRLLAQITLVPSQGQVKKNAARKLRAVGPLGASRRRLVPQPGAGGRVSGGAPQGLGACITRAGRPCSRSAFFC